MYGSRRINLLYGSNASGESTRTENARTRIAVALFSDARQPDQGTGAFLGRIRQRYGIPTASVYAQQDPVIWVSEGIARGLALRGYTVERVTSSLSAADLPTITGTLTKVTSGMYRRVEAHIEADVALEQSGRTIASQQCVGSTLQWAGTASAAVYEEVFRRTMTQFIDDCVPKLVGMIQGRRSP
jgi:hypothetical protein